jgi:hypothetical protein
VPQPTTLSRAAIIVIIIIIIIILKSRKMLIAKKESERHLITANHLKERKRTWNAKYQ